ncbi:MAG: T9SS type A sorting domain-containing protein [Bacteroidetes bacterium]|nr:T9SS type A sorting domain-containing protein [Bacteroidota bacterium]
MKNKILPFRYLVYVIGLSFFLFLSFSAGLYGQTTVDWVELGPNNMAGKTKAVIFDNQDASAQTVYAASTTGGIYITTNLGQTWSKLDGPENALHVSAMVQDASGTIYAGTGNTESNDIGNGIWKSTDGVNFIQIPSTVPNFVSEDWWFIYKLAVDPAGNRIFAATNAGLRYSGDGGNTWTLAKTSDDVELSGEGFDIEVGSNGILLADNATLGYYSPTGNPSAFMLIDTLPDYSGRVEFAIAPSNPDIMFATVVTPTGALNSVWRTSNGGGDWYVVAPGGSTALNFFNSGNNVGDGNGLTNNVLKVMVDDPDRILLGGVNMWEGKKIDDDGFFQWTMRSNGDNNNPASPYYFSYVRPNHYDYVFRPTNSREIMIATQGGVFAGILNSIEFTFEPKHRNYYSTQFTSVGVSGDKRKVIGGTLSNGTVRIDGAGNQTTAKYGYDVYFDANGFASLSSGGYCEIPIIDPMVAIYSQADGNFRRSEDLGVNWSATFFSSDVSGTFTANAGFYAPTILWENFEDYQSYDTTWFVADKPYNTGEKILVKSNNRAFPFYSTTPVALSPGDSLPVKDIISTKYFLGAYDDAIWMTKEILYFGKEPEWFKIADKSNSNYDGTPSSLALSADANYLWVGTQEGRLYRISNLRNAYDYDRADVRSPFCIVSVTEVPINWDASGDPIDVPISSLYVDPNNFDNVILTLEVFGVPQTVMKTTNGLAQTPVFATIQGNIPNLPAFASLIEMDNPDIAFVGTNQGIFMTENFTSGNPTWFVPEDPSGFTIGTTPVYMLKQQLISKQDFTYTYWNGVDSLKATYKGTNNYGVIYAASYGRGLFLCDQFQKPVGIFDPGIGKKSGNDLLIYPNPVSNTANVMITMEKAGTVDLLVFDLNGKVIMQESIRQQNSGTSTIQLSTDDLPNGTYFLQVISDQQKSVSKFVVIK